MRASCYAIYKGDEFIDLGTLKELGEKLGIKPNTVYFYSTPTYKKRIKGPENKRLIVIKIGDAYES